MITVSPGHYGPRTGAHGLIDEGTENIKVAKRVTAILRAAGITTNYVEDKTSKSASKNIPYLITQHNKTSRQIDVSIHFNSSAGTHSRGIGVETLIHNTKNLELAENITNAISKVSGLRNRGVKIRADLGLLKGANKPCYLIEVCFVNDSVDVALYKRDFEKICQAIASELAKAVGKTINKVSSPVSDTDLKFSSKTLTTKVNAIINDRDKQRELIIKAIEADSINESWLANFDKKETGANDILGLALLHLASN